MKPKHSRAYIYPLLQQIRDARTEQGLTYEQVGEKIGMVAQNVYDVISGVRDPRLSSVLRVCQALGITDLHIPTNPDFRATPQDRQ